MSVMSQCYSIIIDRGISATGHGKEVVDGLNATDKQYIYQLMSNAKLTGSKKFDSQILMRYCTQKNDVSLAKQFQRICLRRIVNMESLIRGKRDLPSKRKWTDREYHVQDNADVAHKYVKIYCYTNQFPALPFCGSNQNTHGARALSNHYHSRFDQKLGHGICAIRRTPCACVVCISMLKNVGFLVFCQRNRNATNLSPTLLIGQFWDHITIGISLI